MAKDNPGTTEEGKPVTRFEFNIIFGFLVGIAVVCAIGFLSLLFTYFQQNTSSFETLKEQITTQNIEINYLTTQLEIYSKDKIK